jgi:argininosuccinate lyase
VSDRDFATEIAFACALTCVHLSRLGEELVLWSTTEFGFVRLGEGYCSGSSLMPQKRNPDIAELLRGKPARAIGDVVALLTISKGLALAYNKDLQESQEPLYDAIDTARLALGVLPGLIETLEFDATRLRAAADDPALGATDLAEELVRGGMPFRTAHEVVGRLVRHAEEKKISLRDLGADDLRAVDGALSPKILQALDPARAVAARSLIGGPAPAAVEQELARLEAELRAAGHQP